MCLVWPIKKDGLLSLLLLGFEFLDLLFPDAWGKLFESFRLSSSFGVLLYLQLKLLLVLGLLWFLGDFEIGDIKAAWNFTKSWSSTSTVNAPGSNILWGVKAH